MRQLRLNEEGARDVLLVRAIETEDVSAVVLTREDRAHAGAAALGGSSLAGVNDARATAAYLKRRAEVALERLGSRYPAIERVRTLSGWPPVLGWVLPVAALVAGLAANSFENRQLNILAFPLLGMLAWNVIVYVSLMIAILRRARRRADASSHPLIGALVWLTRPARAFLVSHPALERAVTRFARDWAAASKGLMRHRAARTLHFSAALFAAGIIIGMLARARYTAEYSAGWAGTWAGAEAEIAAFLQIVLGPASFLTGIELPTVERLRSLRVDPENAGDWLKLWATTAAIVVIIPRALLTLYSQLRVSVLSQRIMIEEDFYVRSILRNALGHPRAVHVIPYGFDPDRDAQRRLEQILMQALGDKSQVRCADPVPYGEEDSWLERDGAALADIEHLILIFSLASTPEAENHGAFVLGMQRLFGRRAELSVLLEESAFRRKFGGQPSVDRRIDERFRAWQVVLAQTGLEPILINLNSADERATAISLEQSLLVTASRL